MKENNVYFSPDIPGTRIKQECGLWSKKQIDDFVKGLESTKIPYNSCIWQIDIHHHYDTGLCRSPSENPNKKHTLEIKINPIGRIIAPCGAKFATDCFYNIILGKCKDSFMVSVAEKLLKDKYTKTER